MSVEDTDRRGAEGAIGPRISLDYMRSQVAASYYMDGTKFATHASQINVSDKVVPDSLRRFTICMLVMKNGFIVLGRSAPLSAENFDPEKGKLFAWEDCIRQLWPMYAFAKLQGAPL